MSNTSLLATLVLTAYATSSKKTFKQPALILEQLLAAPLDVTDGVLVAQNQSAPSDALLSAVYIKSKAEATLSQARVCLIWTLASLIHGPKEASWSWLHRSVNEDVALYRRSLFGLYRLAHSSVNDSLNEHIAQQLFGRLLSDDSIAFLAAVWSSGGTLTTIALQDATSLIRGLKDIGQEASFQLILPEIISALQVPSRSTREAALSMIDALASHHSDVLYGSINLYGNQTSSLAPLTTVDYNRYLQELLASRTLLFQEGGIITFHAQFGVATESSKKAQHFRSRVLTSLATHLTAGCRYATFLDILRAFSQYSQGDMVTILLPAIKLLITSTDSLAQELGPADFSELVALLVGAYGQVRFQDIQDSRSGAFDAFVAVLQCESFSHTPLSTNEQGLQLPTNSSGNVVFRCSQPNLYRNYRRRSVSRLSISASSYPVTP